MTHPDQQKNTLSKNQERLLLRQLFNQKIMENLKNNQTFDLSAIWAETQDFSELKNQLTDLKKCLDSFRPLSENEVFKLKQAFDVEYTYQSNKIEGNTLSKNETHLIVNKGFTIKGKTLTEHLEAINHQEAIDYIREIAVSDVPFDKRCLLNIHSLILHGINRENAGRYRQENVMISGSSFIPPSFLQIMDLMNEYFEFYEQNKDTMHPVELAAEMHERLVTIHPFIDSNGCTARLVMNLILLQNGYPITILDGENEKRFAYYDSLELARTGNDPEKRQFKIFIGNNVKKWLFTYLNLLAPNGNQHAQNKGYYFFKKIEPLIQKQ
ncbi:Fic family protein [Conchiformibius kuhniae]|uniref:Fic family protein n=1 Tax=Conchiformibius kuhniae TaxID=211502 RepID=A0A8T9MVK1_9NEIS|nr:Fic family protein [Conchiformibius kuhniae]UOP05154.1 Fic family protein [Conchiformibius kuhniae]